METSPLTSDSNWTRKLHNFRSLWVSWRELSTFRKLWKATISFIMSVYLSVHLFVRPSTWNNSAPTGWIFMKFDIWVFCETVSRKFKFVENLTRITDTLHEDKCKLMIISQWNLLRMRFQTRVVKKIKTHILYAVDFF